jgi:site-specific DNA recombinase
MADEHTVASCVAELRELLDGDSLAERKAFIRSFVKEVKVTGDEVIMIYTIPMLPRGITEEKLPVMCIEHYGGR